MQIVSAGVVRSLLYQHIPCPLVALHNSIREFRFFREPKLLLMHVQEHIHFAGLDWIERVALSIARPGVTTLDGDQRCGEVCHLDRPIALLCQVDAGIGPNEQFLAVLEVASTGG